MEKGAMVFPFTITVSCLFIIFHFANSISGSLVFNFYAASCPTTKFTVRNTVSSSSFDPSIPGKLLCLFFHDCFVEVSSSASAPVDVDLDDINHKGKAVIVLQASQVEPNSTLESSPVATNDDGLDGARFVSNRTNEEVDDGDPFSKRRKMKLDVDITLVVKPIWEPRVVVLTLSEVDILDDGYCWRKYGQKVMRSNPNPRYVLTLMKLGIEINL
ncbi:putative WRKY transcription factor 20 [Glycine max]|nr:putative WRKY transcription factor 20 [Glycine max]